MSAYTPAIATDPLKEKILGYLAADVSQTATALACGVTDGYISQLLSDQEFLDALAIKRAGKLDNAIKHDDTVQSLEQKALNAVEQKLPFVKSAMEAAKVFQILNGSKRHATPDKNSADALGAQQVTLVLPKAASVQISLNSQRQVIEVNGRSMATLPSRALPTLAKEKQDNQPAIETTEPLKAKDISKAAEVLENTAVHRTVINGVVRVL